MNKMTSAAWLKYIHLLFSSAIAMVPEALGYAVSGTHNDKRRQVAHGVVPEDWYILVILEYMHKPDVQNVSF